MEILPTTLGKVLLIKPDIHEDFRGSNVSLYNEKEYAEKGVQVHFVEDKISTSFKHVLRGIHGDPDTWKLISCVYGKVYLVVVNCDKESKEFGKWQSFVLSAENRLQVLVPPNFGNGHLVLSETAVFHYKWSAYYDFSKQFSYRYNDPQFKVWWPIKNPILSQHDEGNA